MIGPGFEPTNVCSRYVQEISSASMVATKRLAGVAPEVNLGECVTCTPLPSTNKAALSGYETQRRCHQKTKTGVSVAPQKGLMSCNFFLKKKVITWVNQFDFFSEMVKYDPLVPNGTK